MGAVAGKHRVGDLAPRAGAAEDLASGLQLRQRLLVGRHALALTNHRPVPLQPEGLERAQDRGFSTDHHPRTIHVLDAQQPTSPVMACIEIAAERCHHRAEVQRTARRGRKASDIACVSGHGRMLTPNANDPASGKGAGSSGSKSDVEQEDHWQAIDFPLVRLLSAKMYSDLYSIVRRLSTLGPPAGTSCALT